MYNIETLLIVGIYTTSVLRWFLILLQWYALLLETWECRPVYESPN